VNPSLGRKVLVVGAHPDDLEMNAGGTIHKLARHNAEVVTVCLTTHSQNNGVRLSEARAAQRHLGVADTQFLDGVDTKLHLLKSQLIEQLDGVVKRERPTTVVTHYHGDTHQDHVTAYEVVAAAARNVQNMLLFKPTFPSGRCDIPFHPNYVCLLSEEDMRAKMMAMSEFKSQSVKYGDDAWLHALNAMAKGNAWEYGGVHGFAEVFQVSRLIA